ncbi:disintegrin and metalloproteinase domain-containing protein 9-like [Grus americana]|uniref:disintegrin and metalloproteinase domain-containing protein 9-like n=1 Tax=Grus americana TaxID=9117 RepID=UPI002407BDE4|nr:disintegrin and metalloproteinase domain-containing protein 9-like [Grus americana]
MRSKLRRVSGAKAFSSCSIRDFGTFLERNRGCPFIRHALPQPSYRATVCGNGVVEPGEQCDCGVTETCALDKCCTAQCNFKPGMKCSLGLCCENCQFKQKNSQCRPPADAQCDLAEFCNGSSASCPPDLYVQDGHECEHGTGYCYKGRCRSPDLQCQALYGRGAKNAPLACYEEVNSQQDRFGHCGNHPKDGYQPCSWPNLGCGKLVCTYPNRIPFTKVKGAVIYAQVQEHLCVSFDFMHRPTALDPLLVKEGTKCGPKKVCMNGTCRPHSVLKYDCNVQRKCHGHGVCNNKKNCHCDPGWNPPQCKTRGSSVGGSIDSALGPGECRAGLWVPRGFPGCEGSSRGPANGLVGLAAEQTARGIAWPLLGAVSLLLSLDRIAKSSAPAVLKNWLLLSFGSVLLALVCGALVITKWSRLKRFCARRGSHVDGPAAEEGSDGRDTDTATDPPSDREPDRDPQPEPGRCRGR